MEAEFDNHPIVVSVLHNYIQDQIVLKKELTDAVAEFDTKQKVLEDKFDALSKKFQPVITKAGKQKADNKWAESEINVKSEVSFWEFRCWRDGYIGWRGREA